MPEVTVSAILSGHSRPGSKLKRLVTTQQDFGFPDNQDRLESFGFKLSDGGAHISRTIMLREITLLLERVTGKVSLEEYRRAVIEENVLAKSTETTRQKTFRHLRELYAVSSKAPIFLIYRELMRIDPQSGPLLSLLLAWARDPLLRATTPAILKATVGDPVTGDDFQQALAETYPHQYSVKNIAKIARNAASSWTQSGHLSGRTKKIRSRVQPRPAALTFALILGHVAGSTGEHIFSSVWSRLLDLNASEARSPNKPIDRNSLRLERSALSWRLVSRDFSSF